MKTWIRRGFSVLALLTLTSFLVFLLVDQHTPLEEKINKERERFINYQSSKDKYQYLRSGLVLRIPAKFAVGQYGHTIEDDCYERLACARQHAVPGTQFSFSWPSGNPQNYEAASNPFHEGKVVVYVRTEEEPNRCTPGGWYRSCFGNPSEVIERWRKLGFIRDNAELTDKFGLQCSKVRRSGDDPEWLCFGERFGSYVILDATQKNDAGWPVNPGSSLSYTYGTGQKVFVSVEFSSRHVLDWEQIALASRKMISEWSRSP